MPQVRRHRRPFKHRENKIKNNAIWNETKRRINMRASQERFEFMINIRQLKCVLLHRRRRMGSRLARDECLNFDCWGSFFFLSLQQICQRNLRRWWDVWNFLCRDFFSQLRTVYASPIKFLLLSYFMLFQLLPLSAPLLDTLSAGWRKLIRTYGNLTTLLRCLRHFIHFVVEVNSISNAFPSGRKLSPRDASFQLFGKCLDWEGTLPVIKRCWRKIFLLFNWIWIIYEVDVCLLRPTGLDSPRKRDSRMSPRLWLFMCWLNFDDGTSGLPGNRVYRCFAIREKRKIEKMAAKWKVFLAYECFMRFCIRKSSRNGSREKFFSLAFNDTSRSEAFYGCNNFPVRQKQPNEQRGGKKN